MSQSNPNEEERQRIVEDATKKLKAPTPPTELEILVGQRNQAREKVITLLRPIVEHAKMDSLTSPNYIHSESGRARLIITAHKLYLDELRKLSKEEAVFLLAFQYAELTISDFC